MLKLSRLDPSFTQEVLAEPGGGNLFLCYSCGTCMSTCLVKRYHDDFNPRRLLRMAALGMREQALSSPTYWLCSACDACYKRCPQGIHISDLMKAVRNIAVRNGYQKPFPTAKVNAELCSGCSICPKVCPYEAIHMAIREGNGAGQVAEIHEALCMNCGLCAAACPSLAIHVEDFEHEEVLARLAAGGWLDSAPSPKIAVFICNWCLRAEEDVVGLNGYPPNIRIVSVPCSGRVDPLFILFALQQGADGVLVAGCASGECHYRRGNYIEQGRLALLQDILRDVGLPEARVHFARLGAADRGKLPRIVEQMAAEVAALNGGGK